MARNVEIKARIESIHSISPKAAALAGDGPIEIIQDDTSLTITAARVP